jgi:hypothetical protein
MVNYQCYRCGYCNNDKTKIKSHLRRLNTCKPIYNNINIDDCKEYILNGLNYEKYLETINPDKSSIMLNNVKKMTKNVKELTQLVCEYCEKNFNNRQSKWYHLKTCKKKKEEEEVKESMTELVKLLNEQLKEKDKELEKRDKHIEKRDNEFIKQLDKRDKQLEKRDKQIDELIKKAGINNSTITQNIQNNIKLLAYKDTDVSSLTDKDILKCMKHSNMCVPHLIKMIHFDPDKPENHNVYISNLKNGYIMAYNGDKWDTKNRDEVIVDMIDDKQGLIEERIEIWIEKGKKYPSIMKKFERYLEIKENNIVINKIKEEIKLMLFNNKILIKERLN